MRTVVSEKSMASTVLLPVVTDLITSAFVSLFAFEWLYVRSLWSIFSKAARSFFIVASFHASIVARTSFSALDPVSAATSRAAQQSIPIQVFMENSLYQRRSNFCAMDHRDLKRDMGATSLSPISSPLSLPEDRGGWGVGLDRKTSRNA